MPPPALLLEHSPQCLLLVDSGDQRIVHANPATEAMLNYPPGGLQGRLITDIETGLNELFFWEEVAAGEYRPLYSVRSEYLRRDGTILPVERSVRPIHHEERVYLLIASHDISSVLMQEQLCARSAALLSTTLEATVDGLLVTALDGHIEHFNHRFAELWSLSPKLLEGNDQGIRAAIVAQLQNRSEFEHWWRHLLEHPEQEVTHIVRLRDGRVIELASRPQKMNDKPIGRVTSFHDITRIKQHEADLLDARDQAQAANQAKSEFLSHMSHELRTPLNAILGFAHLLRDDASEGNREMIGHILSAGQHLLGLINEVLDLASIEAGRLQIKPEPVDLAVIIQECLMLVRPLASARQITLTPPQLATGQYWASADPKRLKQMLINLLSNAIKYNRPEGSVGLTLVPADTSFWRITVSDTGVGLSREELAQLFQPFSRVGEHQHDIEGSGIGLAFTRKLALLMHGQIGVDSTPGRGSRFWIDLPASAPATPRASQGNSEASAAAQSAKVLYIEDDELSQRVLQSVFAKRRPQFCLLVAGTLGDGLLLLEQAQPDLLLLDLHLPDGQGLPLLQAVRATNAGRTVPIIALSGDADPAQAAAALESGFAGYLTKPLQIDIALQHIDDMLAALRVAGRGEA
ncbi:PAS domain-containing hybrid sensor histidine kinase/response regulator [Chitinilyticum litopenaei]|uniref:PAS domain-containing hybrid sensor histidine kinase/response regulator n=1 Tax=Chitinilyticum litopenaei TaxID=1121276 RepID=UPI00040450C4|nr:PAS domain-containing hybrid sensor histidine kinase/response regulator [Chitinilyticum litopenaei]